MVDLVRTERFTVIAPAGTVSAATVERVTGARVESATVGQVAVVDSVAPVARVASVADVLAPAPIPALHFTDGHIVSIDGAMLIGRSPRVERVATTSLPRLVPVGERSSAISRTHLRISVDGARILLEDLDSTNGTAIVPVDGAPFRLAPGEPAVLTDGMVVTIADHLAFRVVSA